jgi:hypothetical protein
MAGRPLQQNLAERFASTKLSRSVAGEKGDSRYG